VRYEEQPHDVVLRADHPSLYKPPKVNPNFETDTHEGDVDRALAEAAVAIDRTYVTPHYHKQTRSRPTRPSRRGATTA